MASRLDKLLQGATVLSRIGDEPVPHQLAQMVYGDPGSGKTVLLQKLAQEIRGDGRILFLDALEGFVSLEDPQWEHLREKTVRFRVDDPKDLAVWAEGLQTSRKLEEFSVVVLDELSTWVRRIAEGYVRDLHGTGPDEMMPKIEGHDWGPIGALTQAILSKFLASGRHVLIAAHSRQRGGGDDDGTPKTGKFTPNFTPLLGTDIQGMLHQTTLITNRLAGRGKYERTLHTRPSASVAAKSRIAGMPMNPTEKQFIQLTAGWTNGTVGTATASPVRANKTELPAEPVADDDPQPEDDTAHLDDEPVIATDEN